MKLIGRVSQVPLYDRGIHHTSRALAQRRKRESEKKTKSDKNA